MVDQNEHKPLRSCDEHAPRGLPYLAFHEEAERRTKRGERQKKCQECGLWSWPERRPDAEV